MKIGKYNINLLDTGLFRLDGGAMFGVVPKPLWSRQYDKGDDLNRIPLSARPLLITYDDKKILVDTGNGTKMNQKFIELYSIDKEKSDLSSELKKYNLTNDDITDVILTHLHFDHTGGSTLIDNNEVIPAFKNANYYIQKNHLKWALNPTEKDRASFIKENFEPLINHHKLTLIDGNEEIFPNIYAITLNGHTQSMQSIKIHIDDTILYYCTDLCPTSAHLGLPYSLAYDNFPLQTIEEKKLIFNQAVEENWTIIYEHDAFIEASKISLNDKGSFVRGDIVKINE